MVFYNLHDVYVWVGLYHIFHRIIYHIFFLFFLLYKLHFEHLIYDDYSFSNKDFYISQNKI